MQALACDRDQRPATADAQEHAEFPGARQEWPRPGPFGQIEHFRAVHPGPSRTASSSVPPFSSSVPAFHAVVDQLDAFHGRPPTLRGRNGYPGERDQRARACAARPDRPSRPSPGNPACRRTERRRPGMPAVAPASGEVRVRSAQRRQHRVVQRYAFLPASGSCPAASALSSDNRVQHPPGAGYRVRPAGERLGLGITVRGEHDRLRHRGFSSAPRAPIPAASPGPGSGGFPLGPGSGRLPRGPGLLARLPPGPRFRAAQRQAQRSIQGPGRQSYCPACFRWGRPGVRWGR